MLPGRRRPHLPLLCVLSLLLVGCDSPPGNIDYEQQMTLGTISGPHHIISSIKFSNNRNRSVEFLPPLTTCNCSVLSAETTVVAPGSEYSATIYIDPTKRGYGEQHINLYPRIMSDGEQVILPPITNVFEYVPTYLLDPAILTVTRPHIVSGNQLLARGQFTVVNSGGTPVPDFTILNSDENFSYQITNRGHTAAPVELTFDIASVQTWPIRRNLVISSIDPDLDGLQIRVRSENLAPYSIEPSALFINGSLEETDRHASISVRSNIDDLFLEEVIDSPSTESSLTRLDRNHWNINLQFNGSSPQSSVHNFREEITLHFDGLISTSTTIPVFITNIEPETPNQ